MNLTFNLELFCVFLAILEGFVNQNERGFKGKRIQSVKFLTHYSTNQIADSNQIAVEEVEQTRTEMKQNALLV